MKPLTKWDKAIGAMIGVGLSLLAQKTGMPYLAEPEVANSLTVILGGLGAYFPRYKPD